MSTLKKGTDLLDMETSGREDKRNEHQLFAGSEEYLLAGTILLTSECSYYLNWETSSQVRNTLSTKPSTSAVDFGSILKIGRGRKIGGSDTSWCMHMTEKANVLIIWLKSLAKVSYHNYIRGQSSYHFRIGGNWWLWQWANLPEIHISFLMIINQNII